MEKELLVNGPTWDLECEYPQITSDEFHLDWQAVKEGLVKLQGISSDISLFYNQNDFTQTDKVRAYLVLQKETQKIAANISTYLNCRLSVNVKDKEAKTTEAEFISLTSQLAQASTPIDLYLMKMPSENLEVLFRNSEIASFRFVIERKRLLSRFSLSETEENLILSLRQCKKAGIPSGEHPKMDLVLG